ncbi:MAG: ABC transporter ATP-binding protein [Candidatus Thermoplasmatota archaeon]|nr:ABC transporter ATP-binding protein [Candidatus Thermoplasmatota archaeon]
MTAPAIATERLTKVDPSGIGVTDLSLTVHRGEACALLGPTGAGKTTLLRLLLDLVHPTHGVARILGLDCQAQGARARSLVGYAPASPRLPARRTGEEILEHVARLRGQDDRDRMHDLAERFDLPLDRPSKELTAGQRRCLLLVQAFMHRPEVLLLDEPTAGLGEGGVQVLGHLVAEAASEGRGILWASRSLQAVKGPCDRVALVAEGRLVGEASMAEVQRTALRTLRVTFADEVELAALAGVPGVHDVRIDGRVLTCRIRGSPDAFLKAVSFFTVDALETREPGISDLFEVAATLDPRDGPASRIPPPTPGLHPPRPEPQEDIWLDL